MAPSTYNESDYDYDSNYYNEYYNNYIDNYESMQNDNDNDYDDVVYNESSDSSSPFGPVFTPGFTFFVLIGFCLITLLRAYMQKLERRRRIRQLLASRNNSNGNNDEAGEAILSENAHNLHLTLQDGIDLYSEAFDINGNQATLKEKHIVVRNRNSKSYSNRNSNGKGAANNEKVEEDFEDIELGGEKENQNRNKSVGSSINSIANSSFNESTYLAIESERDDQKNQNQDDNKNDEEDNDKTKEILKSEKDNDNNNNNNDHKINGACVICMENFIPGEVIVWSENQDCNHAFHKKCMVEYLATNSQRGTRGRRIESLFGGSNGWLPDVSDNPCPTCRRNFCTVSDENFVNALLKRANADTADTTATTTTMANVNDNNEDGGVTNATTTSSTPV